MALERHQFEQFNNSQGFLTQNPLINLEDLPISEESDTEISFGVPAGEISTDRYSRYWECELKRRALQQVLKELSERELPGGKHPRFL